VNLDIFGHSKCVSALLCEKISALIENQALGHVKALLSSLYFLGSLHLID
jgi:hypothetical protein